MVYDVTFYIIIFSLSSPLSRYYEYEKRYYLPLSIVIIIIRKKGVPKHMFDLIKENVAYESFLMYDYGWCGVKYNEKICETINSIKM